MASAVVVSSQAPSVTEGTKEVKVEETIRQIVVETVEKEVNDVSIRQMRNQIDRAIRRGRVDKDEFRAEADRLVRNVADMVVQVTALREADKIIEEIEKSRGSKIPAVNREKILRQIADSIEAKMGKDLNLMVAQINSDVETILTNNGQPASIDPTTTETAVKASAKAIEASKSNNPETYFYAQRAEDVRQIRTWAEESSIEAEKSEELIRFYTKFSQSQQMARGNRAIMMAKKNALEGGQPNLTEVVVDRAEAETRAFLGILRSDSKVQDLVQGWQKVYQSLGRELPDVPEIKAINRMIGVLEKNPELMKLAETARQVLGVWDGGNGLAAKLVEKIGLEKLGATFLEKVGGQAMVNFAGEAIKAFGSVDTAGGMANLVGSLLKQLISKGAISGATATAEAGTAAAGGAASGGLTGLIAAFQALPVVGQIIAVVAITVAAGVWAYKKFVRPVVDKVKGWLKNIGIDTEAFHVFSGLKRSLKENLGGLLGGVLGFGLDVANMGIYMFGIALSLAFLGIVRLLWPVIGGTLLAIVAINLLVLVPMQSTMLPSREVMKVDKQEEGGVPGEFTPVDPIYGENCQTSLACVAMEALMQNGFTRVVSGNIGQAVTIIRALIGKFPLFNIARFITVMDYNTRRFGAFQCIGYSIASDPGLTTSPSWQAMYAGNQSGCVRVAPTNAGVGDHIVFPLRSGHYHIGVLVAVRPDGSAKMYDVNTDGNGKLHMWSIMNLTKFVSGDNSRNQGQPLTILRCGG